MTSSPKSIGVYLEIDQKRTFASPIKWPGWRRGGRDEMDRWGNSTNGE